MQLSASLYLAVFGFFGVQQALACCSSGCLSVDGRFFSSTTCSGNELLQVNANYGSSSGCVYIGGAHSVALDNAGCGSASSDAHFFKAAGCPGGAGGGFAKARGKSGECIGTPAGALYVIMVSGTFNDALCSNGMRGTIHANGVETCGY